MGTPERAFQNFFDLVVGVIDILLVVAAAEVGVDHAALDGAGADDGDFDDEVVVAAWPQAREHAHLGARFDLENTDGVGVAEHVVDGGVAVGDGVELGCPPPAAANVALVPVVDEVDRLAHGGEHAETEDINFHHAHFVDVVLVPLDDGAVGHGGVFDGDDFAEGAFAEHEAADVLGEVAREAHEFAGEGDGLEDGGVVGVEAVGAEASVVDDAGVPPVTVFCETVDAIERESEGFADFADGAAAAVADDLRGEGGAVPAVLGVEVLDDFLTAFVFEVDVDVGGLVAFLAHEAFDEEVDGGGIDGGDAEAVADGGVRSGAAALAEDIFGAGEGDDVVDGKEVGGVIEFLDQCEFVTEAAVDVFGNAVRITLAGSFPRAIDEVLHHRFTGRADFGGIVVFELFEREAGDALGDLQGAADGLRVVAEEAEHFGGALDVAFGVGEEVEAGLLDGAALADAGENVLEFTAGGVVVVDVVGGDEGDPEGAGEPGEFGEAGFVVAVVNAGGGEGEAVVVEGFAEGAERFDEAVFYDGGRDGDGQVSFGVFEQVVEREVAFAFFARSFPLVSMRQRRP